ncbi:MULTISPECIES: hypothetical protein [unclassified Microcoleus]|uniref:hypothetical protein n=2 Tax=unclassified Microcoleus TaxID=2642155 RepID=UPI0025DC7E23|nr:MULTISPECIES: hypothetical protein [unclassified Microcoleus]
MTNTVSLRSRVMGNYQARFWRAATLVRESLTLIENAARNIEKVGMGNRHDSKRTQRESKTTKGSITL